jgi:hypothetical protein
LANGYVTAYIIQSGAEVLNDNKSLKDVSGDMETLRTAIAVEKEEIQRLFRLREFDAMPEVHRRLARLERQLATLSHDPGRRVQGGGG